jgi:hypothetical protein
MDVGNKVKNRPVIIQPGEKDLWALLQRNSGKNLYRPNLGISGVDADGVSPERPVMAHYDRRSAQVRLIEIPDELKSAEGLEVLKGLLLPAQDFVEAMEMRSALLNLVCAEAGIYQKNKGEHYSHDEIWKLKKSLNRIILSMEGGVSSGSGIRYAEPTAAQLAERARAEEFKRAAWEETKAKAQDEGRPLAVRRRAEADAGADPGTDTDTRPSDSDVAAKPDADVHVAKPKPDEISGPV